MSKLRDQVAIITGASRGLGRATAQALAREGAHVVVTARTAPQLAGLARELQDAGVRSLAVPMDVADQAQVDAMVARTLAEFGRIDILINNAAINHAKPFEQATAREVDELLDINLRGAIHCAHAAYRAMVKQKSGTIVNVGSVLSYRVVPNNAVYCATKYALLGFSRALMLEAKPHNIRVMAFLPGGMATSWYDQRPDIDTSWMMQADSVAEMLIHMLSAPTDAVPYELIIAPNTGTSWP